MLARRRRPALTALALCASTAVLLRLALPAASWARLPARRIVPPPMDEPVKPLPPRAAEARPKSAGAPFPLACGDVDLVLDGFGGFGSASYGGDAFFFNGATRAATVFEAMAHLRNAGFLDGESMSLPQDAAGALLDGDAVVASYVRGPFRFDVRTQLVQCDQPSAATLEQRFVVTHVGANPVALTLAHYLDGDLFFAGGFGNDVGVMTPDALYQFDEGSDPFSPSAFVELRSEAPLAVRTTREVGEFPDQRRRLNRNLLLAGGLVRANGTNADADGDGVTDSGFDVSLAIQHEFGTLRPGDRVEMTTWIRWGVGRLADVDQSDLSVDAGEDRVLECEGTDGTAVTLHGTSTDDARIASWSWSVDGAPVATGQDAVIDLLPGAHAVELDATDDAGQPLSDQAAVTIVDTTPPVVAAPEPVVLWPPDHRLVAVTLPVVASDACSSAVDIVPLRVESNEPDDVRHGGDGRTQDDALILGGVVHLRRERQGDGSDRIYRVSCEARDEAGNATPVELDFVVPHDQRPRGARP
jgi:hypothetical protein